jgi:archaellum component FlaC
MINYKKKEIDYINERFTEMSNEINTLKSSNTELKSLLDRVETKLLELQFNGDDNASYESEVSIKKNVFKQTSATPTPTVATSKSRKVREFQ